MLRCCSNKLYSLIFVRANLSQGYLITTVFSNTLSLPQRNECTCTQHRATPLSTSPRRISVRSGRCPHLQPFTVQPRQSNPTKQIRQKTIRIWLARSFFTVCTGNRGGNSNSSQLAQSLAIPFVHSTNTANCVDRMLEHQLNQLKTDLNSFCFDSQRR